MSVAKTSEESTFEKNKGFCPRWSLYALMFWFFSSNMQITNAPLISLANASPLKLKTILTISARLALASILNFLESSSRLSMLP